MNPGHKDALILSMSVLLGAITLFAFATALFCFYSAYQHPIAIPFGIAMLVITGMFGYLGGDMFCEGCGRKGWM